MFKLAFLFGLFFYSAMSVSAQSFYDNTGYKIATKKGNSTYEVTGSVFVIRNGVMIPSFDGELREEGANFYRVENGRVNFYRFDESLVGYYIPAEQRFVRSEGGKEDYVAVLLDGEIFTTDSKPAFKLDEGFEPEIVGMILFHFLGY